jgi:hypothetical protein
MTAAEHSASVAHWQKERGPPASAPPVPPKVAHVFADEGQSLPDVQPVTHFLVRGWQASLAVHWLSEVQLVTIGSVGPHPTPAANPAATAAVSQKLIFVFVMFDFSSVLRGNCSKVQTGADCRDVRSRVNES